MTAPPPPSPPASASALAPLRHPVFRLLWVTWLTANICMWMNDVTAAWLMTRLNPDPFWVALVQSAASLPVCLLAVPAGALADLLDRKWLLVACQLWGAAVAATLALVLWLDQLTIGLLLALTFAHGAVLAVRWPLFAAVVPELVPRADLPAAMALNMLTVNIARIVGPLAAGTLIASAGEMAVFVLNATLSLLAAALLLRWQPAPRTRALAQESLGSAMRTGWQYVEQSPLMRGVLARTACFYLTSMALLALLPVVALRFGGAEATTYAGLLASMGVGAVAAAAALPGLRRRVAPDTLVAWGAQLQALSMVAAALSPHAAVAAAFMVISGGAWITTANMLAVTAQTGLPDWVRARGMAFVLIAIMGTNTLGAALWGQVATRSGVETALVLAALSGSLLMFAVRRWMPVRPGDDLTPFTELSAPALASPPASGHVQISIEYRIDPARAEAFRAVMQESRRNRLQHGALSWELLQDLQDPARFVEQYQEDSWAAYLRRFERLTVADVALRDRRWAFHLGKGAPVVRRCRVETARG